MPYTLTGKEVDLRATEKAVEIFYQRRRVASHPRSTAKGVNPRQGMGQGLAAKGGQKNEAVG